MDGFWAKALRAMEQGPRAKQAGKHGVHGHEDMKGMALRAIKRSNSMHSMHGMHHKEDKACAKAWWEGELSLELQSQQPSQGGPQLGVTRVKLSLSLSLHVGEALSLSLQQGIKQDTLSS